jgi:polysaccharide biosynthesis/export protein
MATDTEVDRIMEKKILMTHKYLRVFFVVMLLFALLTEMGAAQITSPSFASGSISSGETKRNSTDTPAAMQTASMLVPSDITKLRLAPGFMLGLTVLDDSDFAGSYRIDEQGNLYLPIIGSMHVAGKTIPEARAQIRNKLLKEAILKNPQVILTLLEYTAPEVTIIGEVGSPGRYPLLVPHKLVDVLTFAGGPTAMAGNEIQITHSSLNSKPSLIHYSKGSDPKLVENILVYPGDTIQVKRAGIVYVLGAVNRPGGYVMQEENTLNILQAISLANGTSVSAKTSTIYVLRKNADGTIENIALPYKKIIQGKCANMQLRSQDIVYMPASMIKTVFANSGQAIFSSAATSAIYVGIGR